MNVKLGLSFWIYKSATNYLNRNKYPLVLSLAGMLYADFPTVACRHRTNRISRVRKK
jgi:hypothetical protein